MSRRIRTTCATLLVAAAVAGCGSDDDPSTTGLATPGSVPSKTASTGATPPASTQSVPDAAPSPGGTTTDTEANVPDADQPILCPSDKAGGAPGAFDARELEGRPLAEAQATAKARGCSVRVARRDGEDLMVTQDLSTSRINVEVTDGRVTRVLGVA
ncbi:hypothetical protein [Patulibacter americanus]|uniref:hypothetical protein n=1 Tax=Patulibacter americanus TaxID=588672 RepID=UPI0003B69B9C|nr:hypothetical protein [Patulibacter americanus]